MVGVRAEIWRQKLGSSWQVEAELSTKPPSTIALAVTLSGALKVGHEYH